MRLFKLQGADSGGGDVWINADQITSSTSSSVTSRATVERWPRPMGCGHRPEPVAGRGGVEHSRGLAISFRRGLLRHDHAVELAGEPAGAVDPVPLAVAARDDRASTRPAPGFRGRAGEMRT